MGLGYAPAPGGYAGRDSDKGETQARTPEVHLSNKRKQISYSLKGKRELFSHKMKATGKRVNYYLRQLHPSSGGEPVFSNGEAFT
jgi:hypothetical protein